MKTLVRGFFRRLRRFTLYRKLVLSFMALLAIFSLVIAALLYTLFTHVMHQEYKYMAQNSLVSADSVLQNASDKLSDVFNEVLSLPNLSVFFLNNQADRVNEAYIFSELRRMKNLYPYIEKISLVNFSSGRYLGTDGAADAVDPRLVDAYEQSHAGGMVSFRRMIPESIRFDQSPAFEVNTFAFFPAGQYVNSAIVLDLRDEYLIDLLNPADIHPMDQIFLITDEEVLIGREIVEELDWPAYFNELAEDDFHIMDIGDVRCAVTARYACIPGWKLVRVMPMVGSGILTKQLSVQIMVVLVIFLAAVLAGVRQMIRRIYTPVETMVEEQVEGGQNGTVDEISLIYDELMKRSSEIRKLTQRLSHSQTIFNGSWVKSQLLGDVETSKKIEKLAREQGGLPPNSPYRYVAVLAVDHYRQYNSSVDAGERGLHDFAISNILNELLGSHIMGALVRMDEQKLACILSCQSGVIEPEVLEALREFQKNFSAYFKQTVSIGLSAPAALGKDAAKSYQQACMALQSRFYKGTGSLNLYEIRQENRRLGYPVKEEREILEAALTQDENALYRMQMRFLKDLDKQEESRTKGYTERCINSLITGLASRSVLVEHNDIHSEVYMAETMEELEGVFLRWGRIMLTRCREELKKDKAGEENPVLVAQNYVKEHYSEPDLSVEFLAGMVDLSPAYFGKQFSNILNISCSDYITDVRLENAARLLRETALPVQEISDRVGVGSINYFYRLFKKKYGDTPVGYRKKKGTKVMDEKKMED